MSEPTHRWLCAQCEDRNAVDCAEASAESGQCAVCGERPVRVAWCEVPGICNAGEGAGTAPAVAAPMLAVAATVPVGDAGSGRSVEIAGAPAVQQMEMF